MNRKGRKIISMALAFALAISTPASSMLVHAAEPETIETTGDEPVKPTLPDNFTAPLEDNGGMTLADKATTSTTADYGIVIHNTVHWNNQNSYHASVKDTSVFQSKAFTVLFDVKQDPPSSDTNVVDNRVAFTIGNKNNSIHLLTYSGKLGYGADSSGVSNTLIDLSGVEKDAWNAVAMTYEETEDHNGHITVYVNGVKAADVADIGFRFSTMTDVTAMIARTFNTSYMQQGSFDNIVVGDSILDETTALAETAYRKYIKDNPTTVISIQGSDVDQAAANMNGLTYKGFGMLNGNSTSNLLLEYKDKAPEKYNEMMEYLFGGEYPLFTHIKMEMGNDGNNSTGAESCTMRYEDEEADASRSPGFVMAADAKKINPNVKISILRWEMPNWVKTKWNNNTNNQGYEAVYKWYKETIFDAYEKYGYVVDFVDPDKNETSDPDEAFIKWYAKRVANETDFPDYMDEEAREAYRNIRIIASDENKGLQIVPSMRADKELYDAVDIIGFHYRTNATDDYVKMADVDDKEVWYSEGCATFGYTELQENKTSEYGYKSIGGYQSPLALMDSFITAFDSSRRTHYMFQPAIGAFYEGIQYGHKELLSARDPWSGYIHYDPALYMLEHFAKFAKTGWEDSEPDTNDIWRVITSATDGAFEGSESEHNTAGITGNAGYMTLAAPDKSNFSVVLVNNTKNQKNFFIEATDMNLSTDTLNLWVTETDSYLENKGAIEKTDGGWQVTLPAYSITTATTLDTVPERTPQEGIHNEDRAVLDTDSTGGTNGVTDDTVLYADNFEYAEEAEDFLEKRGNEPRYMLDTHGAWIVENGRLKQENASSVNQWNGGEPSTIVGDFRWMDTKTSIDVEIPNAAASSIARLTVRSQTGMNWDNSGYTVCISGDGNWELYRIGEKVDSGSVETDPNGRYTLTVRTLHNAVSVLINGETVSSYIDTAPMLSGRVKISSNWNQIYFDNLLVETVNGGIPYATSMVDGQDDCVTYEGEWTIDNPGSGSADDWYRTLSVTSTAGASFSFPINGCGFSILGINDGSAKLDVYADGTLIGENLSTTASVHRGETYTLSNLSKGAHNIKVVVKSGTLKIDALYTLGERLAGGETIFAGVKTDTLPSIASMTPDTVIKGLPDTVEAETLAGTVTTVPVTWNTSTEQFVNSAFSKSYLTGTIDQCINAAGQALTVTVPIDMYILAGTVYFIDTVDATPKANATTEDFEIVKSFLGDQLLNQVSDQLKTDDNTWGLVDTDAGTKGYSKTSDKTDTGIYGAKNEKGETLSYAFTLPAGTYRLTSAHREWWGKTRPMTASISYGDTTIDAGNINLSGSSGDILHTVEFTLDEEELVTYTLTSDANEAPVISWLGIADTSKEPKDLQIEITKTPSHTHTYTYTDNGNGTHTAICKDNDSTITEAHNYINGVCICGAKQPEASNPDTPDTTTPVLTVPTKELLLSENPGLPGGNSEESKNSTFAALSARVSKSAKTSNKLQWNKIKNADGYVVYGSLCNTKSKKYKYQVLSIIEKNSTTAYTHKGLKKGNYYKYIVSAYKMVDGKLQILATSKTMYASTTGGSYGNIGSLKLNKSKVTLKPGKKVTLKVTEKSSYKKFHRYRKAAFESSNKKIATVNSKGVIQAKKKGTCYIYVYAQNGIYKKVKVTVKK